VLVVILAITAALVITVAGAIAVYAYRRMKARRLPDSEPEGTELPASS
jgi:hypothetical protein